MTQLLRFFKILLISFKIDSKKEKIYETNLSRNATLRCPTCLLNSVLFCFIHFIDVGLQGNLLENPNFAPATGWNERGFAYDIITCPWYLIQPSLNQYRLESAPCGKKNSVNIQVEYTMEMHQATL